MSIADKLTQVAENTHKVYDAGYNKGYSQAESDYLDYITDYGNRKNYESAFQYTAFEYIRPNSKIAPTSRTMQMFNGAKRVKRIEKQYFDLSNCSITSQTANVNGHYATFQDCNALEIGEDLGMQPGGYYYTYANCSLMHTLEVLRVLETTQFNRVLFNCDNLENLTIEGTIGQNKFDVSESKKLTHDSLMSVINALQTNPTIASPVVTLGTTNLAKLTDAEIAIATEKGWTIG